MGNTFSDVADASTSSQNKDQHEPTFGCFNEIESNHLRKVQQRVREDIYQDEHGHNFIMLIWRHAHSLATNTDVGGKNADMIDQRCKQLETITRYLNVMNPLNYLLRQKFLETDNTSFFEFLSNVCTGAYNNKTTLDFVWEMCCYDGSKVDMTSKLSAFDIVTKCFEIAELAHYMLIEGAFELSNDGSTVLKEPRNTTRVKGTIQSLNNSLVEYTTSFQTNHDYGGLPTRKTVATDENDTVSKSEFTEWQRKIVPDLFRNSVEQFLQILLFPPEYDKQAFTPLFRRHNCIVPILHSSTELIPRIASKLKNGNVVPMKSAVFGPNYANSQVKTNNDSTGRAPTTIFLPEVFAFTAISSSKFGNNWYRIYSGAEDGWTFNQLEHSIIGYQGPTLIVIQASSNKHTGISTTFGAYTAAKWEKNKKDFFGSADCFLFQLQPTLRVLRSLPKMGTRGGHYMYFHSNTNVSSHNLSKKDQLAEGFGFGGTIRSPRLFVDRALDECKVSSHDTSFEQGHLAFPPLNDPMSFSDKNSSSTLHIDSLEIYAVGDENTVHRGYEALCQYHDIVDANLRNARTVDKTAFVNDLRNGMIESKAFAHRGQVDKRANGYLKGEGDGKANGL